MDCLPTELLYAIGELLPRHTLSQLCRANRRCCSGFQPLLFRLHGHPDDWNGPSAVFWAVEAADASDGASQILALAVLDKVDKFCRIGPGDLDRTFNRRLAGGSDMRLYCRGRSISLLYDSDRADHWPRRLGTHASFNPLHLAAYKGLDSIVAWLLRQGADVNALIQGTPHNAVIPAILANHASTTLLLLAHGAHQAVDMPYAGFPPDTGDTTNNSAAAGRPTSSGRDKPLVTTLAAAIGYGDLAEKLMDSGFVPTANPSEMLYAYAQYGHRSEAFAVNLMRRGAEMSPRMFQHLVDESGRYWAELPVAFLETMQPDSALSTQVWTPTFANSTVLGILATFHIENHLSDFHDNHYGCHYDESEVEMARRALHSLLMVRGVDPDACGRSLWRQTCNEEFNYALVKFLLPPFLEAGMNVQCVHKDQRHQMGYALQEPFSHIQGYRREVPDDLLGATSCYDRVQCSKGIAMQLDVIRLLLQHGALITAATRDHALGDHPVGPSVYTTVGRSSWSVKLCNVLLEHCCSMPEEKQGEDMRAFLVLYREKTERVSFFNVALVDKSGTDVDSSSKSIPGRPGSGFKLESK